MITDKKGCSSLIRGDFEWKFAVIKGGAWVLGSLHALLLRKMAYARIFRVYVRDDGASFAGGVAGKRQH